MNDMDNEVRQLLRDKASEMPPHLDVPPSLRKRVRPRIARNALLAVAVAAVVTVVAIAGLRSLNGPPEERSLGTGGPAGPAQCPVDQLEPSAALEGAAGSRGGSILLRNGGGATCTLSGPASVAVTDSDSRIYAVTVDPSDPTWMVDRAPKPAGWPVVTLAPGDSAAIRFSWSNWCRTDVTPILQFQADDGSVVANYTAGPNDVPPCNGMGEGSTIQVGPFEPST
jgi:Protein of unknown function (DUF4232)